MLAKPWEARLASVGEWLAAHQRGVRRAQWAMVAAYVTLLAVPALLPLPGNDALLWNNLTRLAQFVFWGLWWPGVILVTALFGRVWCGLLCPEGFLSETMSGRGLGRALPRWLLWGGWPTTAFITTTVYGQLTSVYQYPRPALLVLGGSTIAAMAIGWRYGRNKRVWCRYLCPAGSVLGVLAKIAPFQFEVDQAAWKASQMRREKPEWSTARRCCRCARWRERAAATCAAVVPVSDMRSDCRSGHHPGRSSKWRAFQPTRPRPS